MKTTRDTTLGQVKHLFHTLFSRVPLLGWLFGILIAVILESGLESLSEIPLLGNRIGTLLAKFPLIENGIGTPLAKALKLPKIPALWGIMIMLKKPILIFSAFMYTLLIYIIPIGFVAWLTASVANKLAAKLLKLPIVFSVAIHLCLLYASLHIWADVSGYRLLTLKLTLISIMLTLSLNLINGYMGEFSCSHPGFMALGAYAASIFTVGLFTKKLFGPALLPSDLAPFLFPIALILGGLVAAVGALAVAIPAFRTRGDYLAIISLAFMFIVKSLIDNLQFVGGARGLSGQPDLSNLPTVFVWTVLCVWIINNYVRSTLGKAVNALRDNEMAANAMTVDTRHTKMTAFMFAAFWAGVAGGLFAHVLRYVNPGTFSIQKLAEVLAMVYFGGLNSPYGSIVGAVSISLLGEALRPLEIFKWIIIPLLLILVMIYRPTGLIAFKELKIEELLKPRTKPEEEV